MEIAFLPPFLFSFAKHKPSRVYHLNVLLSSAIVLVVLYLIYNPVTHGRSVYNICLIEYFFGIECPFCGCSRAIGALMQGDIHSSLEFNRAGVIFAFFLIVQLPLRVILLLKNADLNHLLSKLSRIGGWIVLSIFILNWIFNISMQVVKPIQDALLY